MGPSTSWRRLQEFTGHIKYPYEHQIVGLLSVYPDKWSCNVDFLHLRHSSKANFLVALQKRRNQSSFQTSCYISTPDQQQHRAHGSTDPIERMVVMILSMISGLAVPNRNRQYNSITAAPERRRRATRTETAKHRQIEIKPKPPLVSVGKTALSLTAVILRVRRKKRWSLSITFTLDRDLESACKKSPSCNKSSNRTSANRGHEKKVKFAACRLIRSFAMQTHTHRALQTKLAIVLMNWRPEKKCDARVLHRKLIPSMLFQQCYNKTKWKWLVYPN